MEKYFNFQELAEIMKISGEVRGNSFKGHGEFVLLKRGAKALRFLEEQMACLGFSIDYRKARVMDFYPLKWNVVSFLLMKRALNFTGEEIEELGQYLAKTSFILKLFMRHFMSVKRMAKEASRIWEKNYTVGRLETAHLDEEKKEIVLRLKDFYYHPLHCLLLKGYLNCLAHLVVGTKVECREIKCPYRGDKYHEFQLTWE